MEVLNRRRALIGSVGAAAGFAIYPAFGQAVVIPLSGLAVIADAIVVAVRVSDSIADDNKKREAFTMNFVKQAVARNPNFNVVICHPAHAISGPDVVHQHYELKMTVGTCGYDAYASPLGKPFSFQNKGDGGDLNWAFGGNMTRNGNTLTAK